MMDPDPLYFQIWSVFNIETGLFPAMYLRYNRDPSLFIRFPELSHEDFLKSLQKWHLSSKMMVSRWQKLQI